MFAEVDELDLGVSRELARDRRHHDLPAVGDTHQPGSAVHPAAVVVTVAHLGFAGVQAHPHPEWSGRIPGLGTECELRVDGSVDRVVRGGERCVEAISGRLHDETAVRLDRRAGELVVPRQRRPHRVGVFLPETRRPLEIGEQERDRPRRQLPHPNPLHRQRPNRKSTRHRSTVQAANQTCGVLRPNRAGSPSGSSPPTTTGGAST